MLKIFFLYLKRLKLLLFPLFAVVVTSGSLLAQNGKSGSDFSNTTSIQCSNIREYSSNGNQKPDFVIDNGIIDENKLAPQLLMNPASESAEEIAERLITGEARRSRPPEPNNTGNTGRVEHSSSVASISATTSEVANIAGETELNTTTTNFFPAVTLGDFGHALRDYPEASRLIIVEKEGHLSIQPKDDVEIPLTSQRQLIRLHEEEYFKENKKIIDTLKEIVPSIIANRLLRYDTNLSVPIPPLSVNKLREVFDQLNYIEGLKRQGFPKPTVIDEEEEIVDAPDARQALIANSQSSYSIQNYGVQEKNSEQVLYKKCTQIIGRNSSYPYLRIEETKNANGNIVKKKEMLADYLIVNLDENISPEDFSNRLESRFPGVIFSLEKIPFIEPLSPLYQLHFETAFSNCQRILKLLPKILKEIEGNELAKDCGPSYLCYADVKIPKNSFYASHQWNLHDTQYGITAPIAWDKRTEARVVTNNTTNNIIVAVIDTGINYTHPNLAANIWDDGYGNHGAVFKGTKSGKSIKEPIIQSNYVKDVDGHGTHVAGIIGAVGNQGHGISGVAWDVKLMACKSGHLVEHEEKDGTIVESWEFFKPELIQCIMYACNNGAKILNCSLGGGEFNEKEYEAYSYAAKKGVIVVTSAGNGKKIDEKYVGQNNDNVPKYPSNYCLNNKYKGTNYQGLDNIVVVAATTPTGELAKFSNYGNSVHLAAPGVDIYSTGLDDPVNQKNDPTNPNIQKYSDTKNIISNRNQYNSHYLADGTSMAAPHVAGALALMMAEIPPYNYKQLITKLLATVDTTAELFGKVKSGGRLNLAKALGCVYCERPQNEGSKPHIETALSTSDLKLFFDNIDVHCVPFEEVFNEFNNQPTFNNLQKISNRLQSFLAKLPAVLQNAPERNPELSIPKYNNSYEHMLEAYKQYKDAINKLNEFIKDLICFPPYSRLYYIQRGAELSDAVLNNNIEDIGIINQIPKNTVTRIQNNADLAASYASEVSSNTIWHREAQWVSKAAQTVAIFAHRVEHIERTRWRVDAALVRYEAKKKQAELAMKIATTAGAFWIPKQSNYKEFQRTSTEAMIAWKNVKQSWTDAIKIIQEATESELITNEEYNVLTGKNSNLETFRDTDVMKLKAAEAL